MNPKHLSLSVLSVALIAPAGAAVTYGADGIQFDSSYLKLGPQYAYGSMQSLVMESEIAALWFKSGSNDPYGPLSGGINFDGTPIRFFLGAENEYSSTGKFEVYRRSALWESENPLFQVDGSLDTATFSDVDVNVNYGSLKVDGSPVVSQNSMPGLLSSSLPGVLGNITGKIKIGNGNAGTSGIAIGINNPTATGSNAIALGGGVASNTNSVAIGPNSSATAPNSIALGTNSTAQGWYSAAVGNGTAYGGYSFAASQGTAQSSAQGGTALSGGVSYATHAVGLGQGVEARAFSEVVVGAHNIPVYSSNASQWIATDPVFTVGNGKSYTNGDESTALQVLKNGKTSIINKTWNSATPLADPNTSDATDADGVALQVKGHAVLEGKVTIAQPQGGISVGIYQ